MKKYIKYVAAIAAMVLGTSCTQELFHDQNSEGDTFSVEAIWSAMETKSPGVDNENKVSSLDYYFFKDATSAAVFHVREEIAAAQQMAKSYKKDFVPGTNDFPAKSALWGTWGEETGVHVFIVANLPSAKVLTSPTLEEIKTVSVDETFFDENTNPLATNANDLFFIMTGEATLKGTTIPVESAEPEVVDLYRLAAKITYDVKVQKSRTETTNGVTETWTPMLGGENVRMYPQGAVKDAYLGVVDGEHYLDNPTTFNYPTLTISSDDPSDWKDSDDGNYYQMKETLGPYYTYPNNWEEGGADTFIKIIIPWQVTRTDSNGNVTYSAQREVYYKVVVPDPEILANHWYQLDITLAPGTENEPEVEVVAGYRVANWIGGGEEGVDGVLKDIKYLIADRSDEVSEGDDNHFVTYTRGISIPYSASNPVIFKVIEASYLDFSTEKPSVKTFVSTNAQGTTTYTNPNPGNNNQKHLGTTTDGEDWSMVQNLSTVESWFKFDNGSTVGEPNGYLVMDHWLNGILTSPYFDVSPYTFTVRIYLQRDPDNYVEELKIVQYPQTYIEAQESTVHADSPEASASNNFYGYIFINGVSTVTNAGSGSPWTTIMSIGGNYGGKTNHNMYILTTGVLSESSMRLGDPREETSYDSPKLVGKLENGRTPRPDPGDRTEDFITAPAVGGGERSLSNYYPTDPEKSPTFIAPKLRISSAFGRRGSNNAGSNSNDDYRYNYASAWNRCAAYQEDGYPAGRWRLPTEAEIDYINRLSQRDFIPSLFYGDTPYWTATPGVAVNGSGTQNVKSASTRCVYDDWYWGSDPVDGAQNKFMWGD